MCLFLFLITLFVTLFAAAASSAQDSLSRLSEETLSYFRPLKGKVLSVEGASVIADIGAQTGIRKGMRISLFRQGASFVHPVTKEPMGIVEVPIGKAEVAGVEENSSVLEIIKGEAKEGDILRISDMKIRMLYFQDLTVDWDLGESYYQKLKGSGRFDLLDTPLHAGTDAQIAEEARRLGAEVVLMLASQSSEQEIRLHQKLIWSDQNRLIGEQSALLDSTVLRELEAARGSSLSFTLGGDVLFSFDLPLSVKLLTAGDVNGDKVQEVIMSTGRDIHVYTIGATLLLHSTIQGTGADDHLWLDAVDLNSDGKDEVIVTSMRDGDIVSSIYGFRGTEVSILSKEKLFLRFVPNLGLIGQQYSLHEGFQSPVFTMAYESGSLKKGEPLKLPEGVALYDFLPITGMDGARYTLAYDEAGYLNLYNESALKLWRSAQDYGRFLTTFKKPSPTVMVEKGEWAIKDRLVLRGKETFVVKRIPLAEVVRGLGYKRSQIKSLLWTGLSMDERTIIDGIPGALLDYAVGKDRIFVLSKPLFGIKTEKILKGENPVGSKLFVYSIHGR